MKPLSICKFSCAEAALRRLEAAAASLEAAAAGAAPASGEAPLADPAEVADLKRRCGELEVAVRAAADGIDKTASRLARLLEE